MKATVSENGRITIPKRLRDSLGLRPGTILDLEEVERLLIGEKVAPPDRLDELVGILQLPAGGTDAFIREIRDPGADKTAD